jgi:putative ABC transport system permease protein
MISLSLQNLARRRSRTALLVVAVAVSSAIVFAGAVLVRSIAISTAIGFSRMGADLMVVPDGTPTNITSALLTVEPAARPLDRNMLERADLSGVRRAAPQRVLRTDQSGFGGHGTSIDLIGFDPALDFTVQPWIVERLGRPMQANDLIVGADHDLPLGSEVLLFGRPFRVYGKLGRTGVGTHERGLFMQDGSLVALSAAVQGRTGSIPAILDPAKTSGFLLEVAPGATDKQVRFALLSHFPGIAVTSGASLLTGIRQGLVALLGGTLALIVLMFASMAIMVSVLFSAIVTERRAELGLLKAIGARRRQIVGMMLGEAMVATGAGGIVGVIFGVLLLRLFERSLIFHLTEIGVPFVWLSLPHTVALGAACIVAASLIGAAGAWVPAWRASRRDAYDLIRGDD